MPEQIIEKICRKCLGDPQPITLFHKNNSNADGYGNICKECRKPVQRAHYERHQSSAKARSMAWAKAHPKETIARVTKWAKDNPEKARANKRRWKERNPGFENNDETRKRKNGQRQARRLEVIAAMGGRCSCCGLDNAVFLCFDHIGGWGSVHRQTVCSTSLPGWIKKHHYPRGGEICPECNETHQGVQLLCYDCNMSVAASPDGTCAHKESFEETKRKRLESGLQNEKARYARENRWQLRESGIHALGGQCFCCGQSDSRFLCFEHVDQWGRVQRAEMPHAKFLQWLKDHGYPKGNEVCLTCGEVHQGIRIACFSCNLAAGKSDDGICPHQQSLKIAA